MFVEYNFMIRTITGQNNSVLKSISFQERFKISTGRMGKLNKNSVQKYLRLGQTIGWFKNCV